MASTTEPLEPDAPEFENLPRDIAEAANTPIGWPWQVQTALRNTPSAKETAKATFEFLDSPLELQKSYIPSLMPQPYRNLMSLGFGYLGLSGEVVRRTAYSANKRVIEFHKNIGLEILPGINDTIKRNFIKDWESEESKNFQWHNFWLIHEPWKLAYSFGKAVAATEATNSLVKDFVRNKINLPRITKDQDIQILEKTINFYNDPATIQEMNSSNFTGIINTAGDITFDLINIAGPVVGRFINNKLMNAELTRLLEPSKLISSATSKREVTKTLMGLYGKFGSSEIINMFEGYKNQAPEAIAKTLYSMGFRTGYEFGLDPLLPASMQKPWKILSDQSRKFVKEADISIINNAILDNFADLIEKGRITAWDQKAVKNLGNTERFKVFSKLGENKELWSVLDKLLRFKSRAESVNFLNQLLQNPELGKHVPDLINALDASRSITRQDYFLQALRWTSEKGVAQRIEAINKLKSKPLTDLDIKKISILERDLPLFRPGYTRVGEVKVLTVEEMDNIATRATSGLRSYQKEGGETPLAKSMKDMADGLLQIIEREAPTTGQLERKIEDARIFFHNWKEKSKTLSGNEKLIADEIIAGGDEFFKAYKQSSELSLIQRNKLLSGIVESLKIPLNLYKVGNLLLYPGYLVMQVADGVQKYLLTAGEYISSGKAEDFIKVASRDFDHLGNPLNFSKPKFKEFKTMDEEKLSSFDNFAKDYFSLIDNEAKNILGKKIYTIVTNKLEKEISDVKVISEIGIQSAAEIVNKTIFFSDAGLSHSSKLSRMLSPVLMYPTFGISQTIYVADWMVKNWYWGTPMALKFADSLERNGVIDLEGTMKVGEYRIEIDDLGVFNKFINALSDPNYKPSEPDEALKLKIGRALFSTTSFPTPPFRILAEKIGLLASPPNGNHDFIPLEGAIRKISSSAGNEIDLLDTASNTILEMMGMEKIERKSELERLINARQDYSKKQGIFESIDSSLNAVKRQLFSIGILNSFGFRVFPADKLNEERRKVRINSKKFDDPGERMEYIQKYQSSSFNSIPIDDNDEINSLSTKLQNNTTGAVQLFNSVPSYTQQKIVQSIPYNNIPKSIIDSGKVQLEKSLSPQELENKVLNKFKTIIGSVSGLYKDSQIRDIILEKPFPVVNQFGQINTTEFIDRKKAIKLGMTEDQILRVDAAINHSYTSFREAVPQISDVENIKKINENSYLKPFINAVESTASYLPIKGGVKINQESDEKYIKLKNYLSEASPTPAMKVSEIKASDLAKSGHSAYIGALSELRGATPANYRRSIESAKNKIESAGLSWEGFVRALDKSEPSTLDRLYSSISTGIDFNYHSYFGRYPKAADFQSAVDGSTTVDQMSALNNAYSRIGVYLSNDPSAFNNWIEEGSRAGLIFDPAQGAATLSAQVGYELLGENFKGSEIKSIDSERLQKSTADIYNKMIQTIPKPPHFSSYLSAASWVSSTYQDSKKKYETARDALSRGIAITGSDGKIIIERNPINPQPSPLRIWGKVIESDPTTVIRFPTQLIETYSTFADLSPKDRDSVQSAVDGIGAAETARWLFGSLGVINPASLGIPGLAVWAGVSLIAGIASHRKRKEARAEQARLQSEIEERRKQYEEEQKRYQAERRDRESWEQVIRSRRTFFDAVNRSPQMLQRFAELRSEEISDYIRRPQYSSSVGLARSMERELGRLLKPIF